MSRLQEVWSSHQKLLISHSKKKQSERHHFYFRPGFKIASNRSSYFDIGIKLKLSSLDLKLYQIILAPEDQYHLRRRHRRRPLDQVRHRLSPRWIHQK